MTTIDMSIKCVCGMQAHVTTSRDPVNKLVLVHIECDHGGSSRSASPPFRQTVKIAEHTLALHNAKTGPIAPLAGNPLGAGQTWQPAQPQSRPAQHPSFPLAVKDVIQMRAAHPLVGGQSVTVNASGMATAYLGSSQPVIGVAVGPSYADSGGFSVVDVNVRTSSNTTLETLLRGRISRVSPAQLKAGDVIGGFEGGDPQQRIVEHHVVVSASPRVGFYRLSVRRVGDDKYHVIQIPDGQSVYLLATSAVTGGDPDRWVEQQAQHEREAAADLKERVARRQLLLAKTGLQDRSLPEWLPQPGDPVIVDQRRPKFGGAQRAIVRRVDVHQLGSEADVSVEVSLLDGGYAGQKVSMRLHEISPVRA